MERILAGGWVLGYAQVSDIDHLSVTMADDEFLTVEEAASRLDLSPATVRRHCANGQIAAHKVGRGWLVLADRLPPPRRRTPRRRPTTASSLVHLPHAVRHLRNQDLVRDLWVPDILRHEDDLQSPDALYATAARRLDLAEPFDAAVTIPVPKSPFFLRNAVNLSLPDRLAFHAAVAAIARPIDALVGTNVYSARLSSRHRRFLKPGTAAWVQWKEAIERCLFATSGWMVETDITSYFDCISHSLLLQDLQHHSAPQPIVDALREMLKTWSATPGTGIPQGPDASRLLGNFYMVPIDNVMSSLPDVHYFRYMDDIRIVATKKHAAVGALKILDAECRRRNLYLSTKKTSLFPRDEAIRSLTDQRIDDAKYAYDTSDDPKEVRKSLRSLFKAAFAKDGVNGRRAKFSIFRLRALRDHGVLGIALAKLEDLAPLGWLVPAYLGPWLRRKRVQRGIEDYLNDPERNTSDFLSTWLLAALLDEPHAVSTELHRIARVVALDKSASSYHRAVALNVIALRRDARDIADLKTVVLREYDPEVVRAALVALKRVGQLDKATAAKSRRIPGIDVTLDYLRGRTDLPSLIMTSLRNKIA